MLKKVWKSVKKFFALPEIEDVSVGWEGTFPDINDLDRQRRERNERSTVQANLDLQRDAYQKQLEITYRMFIVSFLALIVAIAAIVIAVIK